MSVAMPDTAGRPALPKRLAGSILLFLAAFGGIGTISRYVLLPQLLTLQIGDTSVLATEVADLEQEIRRTAEAVADKRDALILPGQDELSRALRADQELALPIPLLEKELKILAHRASGSEGSIVFHKLHYHAPDQRVSLRGDVRNVGPRSMTVLAQFTDLLERHEGVTAMEPPLFVREEDPVAGFHSPFSLQFTVDVQSFRVSMHP